MMDSTKGAGIDKRAHSSLLTTQSNHAPHGMSSEMGTPSPSLSCCCGRVQCAYLQHNTAALVSLECDLRSAARLGQVRLPTFGRLGNPGRLIANIASPAFTSPSHLARSYSPPPTFHFYIAQRLSCSITHCAECR